VDGRRADGAPPAAVPPGRPVRVRAGLARPFPAPRALEPELAAQATRWGAAGAVAWTGTVLVLRRSGAQTPSLAGGLAWWPAVWRMLDWHLGMAEGGDGVPRARLSAGDAVTLARFWLVPVLPAAAREGAALPALVAIGGATDWLDGALARRGGRTRLGRDLDTTADLAFFRFSAGCTMDSRPVGRPGRLTGAASTGSPRHRDRTARAPKESAHPRRRPSRTPASS
jgi:hypothetical protein